MFPRPAIHIGTTHHVMGEETPLILPNELVSLLRWCVDVTQVSNEGEPVAPDLLRLQKVLEHQLD